MIYSPRMQPEENEFHIYEVPKNNSLIYTWAKFHNCGVKER